jgi:hypothetical protein
MPSDMSVVVDLLNEPARVHINLLSINVFGKLDPPRFDMTISVRRLATSLSPPQNDQK